MGNPVGFMLHAREDAAKRPVAERVGDFKEIEQRLGAERLETQASRCMDCGIPYCHAYGCPVKALVPDWNEMVHRRQWRKALDLLHSANNLPEITGRICPALCEAACSLSINQPAVSIRQIELQIIERGWHEGWVRPEPAAFRTGRKIAIIGSGPAGLSAAQQLARRGHQVVVFERDPAVGGVLRYGIPDFKLEKWVIDRRIEQLRAEGVAFETGVEAGLDLSARYLRSSFDALVLTTGSRVPRDLKIPGRELGGIHFAVDFLSQQNRLNAGEIIPPENRISAKGGERRRHRRRRHRRGLHRHLPPAGRAGNPPDRNPSGAARGADAAEPVADVAADPAHLDLARGRLRAAVERDGEGIRRRRGARPQAALRQGPLVGAGRGGAVAVQRSARLGVRPQGRPGAPGDGIPSRGARPARPGPGTPDG